jgi:protein gp37
MATLSHIEWTEVTWNPVTGCDKISAGCKNCYAERMAKRLKAMGSARYENGFRITLHDDLVDLPRKWKKSRIVFVNSMSDLFHPDIPLEFIQAVFRTMNETPQHTYQILTKRSERLLKLSKHLTWTKNIWMGVSVEDERVINRISDLQKVPAITRFLSLEPLIGPLNNLPLKDIHWVIVGGESGPKARPMYDSWVDAIHNQCKKAEVPFFFKQWGGVQKHKHGRLLHERTYDEMPMNYSAKRDYYPLDIQSN